MEMVNALATRVLLRIGGSIRVSFNWGEELLKGRGLEWLELN